MLDDLLGIWPKACLGLCTMFLDLARIGVLQHQVSVAQPRKLDSVWNSALSEALCRLYEKPLYSGRAWMGGVNVQGPYELEGADRFRR